MEPPPPPKKKIDFRKWKPDLSRMPYQFQRKVEKARDAAVDAAYPYKWDLNVSPLHRKTMMMTREREEIERNPAGFSFPTSVSRVMWV